jgi:hypothetical protein
MCRSPKPGLDETRLSGSKAETLEYLRQAVPLSSGGSAGQAEAIHCTSALEQPD